MAVEDLRWWTGSEWVSIKDFNSDSLPPGTAEGQLLQWDGFGWSPAADGVVSGQLLSWDDTNKRWLPMAYIGTDGSGKPIKPILPIGSEDGTVVLGSPAADTFTIETDGTERLRVTGSGQVGIGRTVPAAGPFVAMKAERNVANAVGCSLWMVPGAAATTSYGYYSAPELGATNTAYATHIHYMAIGIPSMPSGSSLTQEWMFYANPTAQTDHAIVGFRSGLNDNGQAGTYAIHASGTANSRFDSQILLNGGSAAAPGLAAVGDENTGFFMPSADVAAISTGGTERFRIRPNGAIGLAQSASVPTTGSNNIGITQRFDLNNNGMLLSSVGYATAAANTAYGLWFQINSNAPDGTAHTGTFIPLMIGTTSVQTGTTIAEWRGINIGDQAVPDKAYGIFMTMAPRAGKERYAIFCTGSAPSRFDGQVQVPAGSPANPSIRLVGDDTGISFETDTIKLSTAGTERMRVSPNGHITAADGYTPTADQDLATRKYVDDLAADHHLPLHSTDGTVRLEAPGPGLFTISTNLQECLRINGSGNTIVENGLIVDDWCRVGGATDGFSYGNYAAGGDTWFGHYVVPPSNANASTTSTYAAWRSTPIPGGSPIATGYGFWVAMNNQSGTSRYQIYCSGTAPSYLGNLQITNGSAAAPALSFLGDTDTGMYRVGDNALGFATNSQPRLTITAGGMLKVGSSYSPTADEDLANKEYVDTQIRANGGTVQTTADLPLANPQDNTFLRFAPQGQYLTQEDANQAFVQGLTERKIVLPISRAAYDALPVKDPDTLYLITS